MATRSVKKQQKSEDVGAASSTSKSSKKNSVQKRSRPTDSSFDDYSEIKEEVTAATVHGFISSLSPMKKSRSGRATYFDGHFVDVDGNPMRFIGFSNRLQASLDTYQNEKQPVELDDCEIKNARRGDKFEVMLKNATKVNKSPRKFDVSKISIHASECPIIQLADVEGKERYERVTVKVKVQQVMDKKTLGDGSIKQDALVADSTGSLKISVWGDCVDKLKKSVSYSLNNFMVKEYFGSKYLPMGKSPRSEIQEIVDIGDVQSGASNVVLKKELKDAEVVAIDELEKHKSCFRCKGRVEPPSTDSVSGRCSRVDCGIFQKYNECSDQWSAKLVVKSPQADGCGTVLLSIYGKMLKDFVGVRGDVDVTPQLLLSTPKMSVYTPGPQNVVVGFVLGM